MQQGMRRPSPGEQMEESLKAERREERREALSALLESEGWRKLLRPALVARMERIARGTATDSGQSLDHLRVEQGRYRELSWLTGLTLGDLGQLFIEE